MVRISKQRERRAQCPHRPRRSKAKTGSLKDNLPLGFKGHENALEGQSAAVAFIPKIK